MKRKLDLRVSVISLGILCALFLPMSFLHEVGHGLACGGDYDFQVTTTGSSLLCFAEKDGAEMAFFTLMGGVFAGQIALIPAIVFHKKRYILIPCLSLGIGHLITAFVETVFYESYISDPIWVPILGFSNMFLFMGLLVKFGRLSPEKDNVATFDTIKRVIVAIRNFSDGMERFANSVDTSGIAKFPDPARKRWWET